MTISIWRYSHLVLAIASSVFLLVASITGVILAVEPISHQAKGYAVEDLDKVPLATTISALQTNYDEVFSLEVESSGFVKASVLTSDFETLDVYINPKTGEQLAEVAKRPAIYSFATNLHRSLFLKSTGRFFVGLISLLLFLIAITGLFLLAKRQGGFKRFFSKVQNDYFELRYHVILSRWFFIPIIILALTGVYLSAEKFELLPDTSVSEQVLPKDDISEIVEQHSDIPFFKETTLSQVRNVEFPFSDDAEDYFQIALRDREIKVNQQTGAIVSSASYPFVLVASRFSWVLHTGEGSVLWSLVLLLASASIIFFMYSGLVMFFKRRKKVTTISEMPDKDDCEIIILVGSETGTTFDFGRRLYNALTDAGRKVFLTELNDYSVFENATHIIGLTATYGEGEATTNARKFEAVFPKVVQPNKISYSIVGFGSLEYPDYCQFAIKVDALLQVEENFQPILPLYKINDANFTAFKDWAKQWSHQVDLPLKIKPPSKTKRTAKQILFTVVECTEINVDDTFLLRLKSKRRVKFTSGDLLNILIEGTDVARQYSIAKINGDILLSIKKHDLGRCSPYLYSLKKGDMFKASIEANPDFHFPKKTKPIVLISNGTGIAPFLGMIDSAKTKTPIHLFWGGRTQESASIYNTILDKETAEHKTLTVHKSFSREGNKEYVQEAIAQSKDIILNAIKNDGVIMICGSLTMQHDMLDTLEVITKHDINLGLDTLEHNNQLKMDCY